MKYNQEQLNNLLIKSATYSLVDLLKECLELGADPKACNSYALRWAAEYGYTECVRLLIPVSDTKVYRSAALYWAAKNGHNECVKLLIPVSDSKEDNSEALRLAAYYGHTECVKLLIPVSDPEVVEYIKKKYPQYRDVV